MKKSEDPEQKYRLEIKNAFLTNVTRLREEIGLSIADFIDALNKNNKNITFNAFTVRGWLREDENRITFPSPPHLAIIADTLGVDLNTLLGLTTPSVSNDLFYSVLRQPDKDNELEEKLLSVLARVGRHYRDSGNSYTQKHLKTIFEFNLRDPVTDEEKFDRFSFYQLHFTRLVSFNTALLNDRRNKELEHAIRNKFICSRNGKTCISDIRVFSLPNNDGIEGNPLYNGIAEAVFFRCAAAYFEEKVEQGDRIGLAGGKSIASMMNMVDRSKKIRNCQFFPLLRIGGGFAAAPITSTSIVTSLIFRFADLGVKLPPGRFGDKPLNELAANCRIICTSLGNNTYSTLLNLLKRFYHSNTNELELLAGDILFNIVDKNGITLENIIKNDLYHDKPIRALAEELINSEHYKKTYKEVISNSQFDLSILDEFASEPDKQLILILAGSDKADILRAFHNRCKPGIRYTLITEESLAKELVGESQS
jgi:hypothetical protein